MYFSTFHLYLQKWLALSQIVILGPETFFWAFWYPSPWHTKIGARYPKEMFLWHTLMHSSHPALIYGKHKHSSASACLNLLKTVPYSDNCFRENKNKYLFSWLANLVELNVFLEVSINFLIKGHTGIYVSLNKTNALT